MEGIGIVGAGVAGLHLALYLQKHTIPVTLYTERTAEQQRLMSLPNIVSHWAPTRARERELEVNHWDGELDGKLGLFCFHYAIGIAQPPLIFRGDFVEPGIAVDHRIYLPKLLEDFEERGGRVVIKTLQASDLEALSEKHDLVIVSSGRGSLAQLFPRIPELSPYTQPPRVRWAGIFHGVTRQDPMGPVTNISSEYNQLIELPLWTFDGLQTAIACAMVPGGDLEQSMRIRYDDGPKEFEARILKALEKYFPSARERINAAEFGISRPQDILQGTVIPTVRRGYSRLENGKFVLAMGDIHITNDPLIGQGANTASHAAFTVGKAILEDSLAFDERWCQRVEARIWDYASAVTGWNNYMTQPSMPQNFAQLMISASQNKTVANTYADNFRRPSRNWDILSSPERTNAFLRRFASESQHQQEQQSLERPHSSESLLVSRN